MINKNIPKDVLDDYYHFKTEAPIACLACNAGFKSNYTHITFKDNLIYFWNNCLECGEDNFIFVTEKILRQIMVKWFFDKNVDGDKFPMTLWRLFRLARHYDSCLKTDADKVRFRSIWHDLNKQLNRWSWWYKIKYRG